MPDDVDAGLEEDVRLEDGPVAAPEHSALGESASNGLAERAVQALEGQVRTMKLALESRIECDITRDHPIMHWMAMHAAFLLTVCHEDANGTTGYEHWHGQKAKFKMPEFGETILYFIPTKRRHSLDAKLKFGICLGRSCL